MDSATLGAKLKLERAGQACPRRGQERLAAERQARRTRLQNGVQLRLHRLPADGQTQTSARSSLGAGSAEMRLLGSTLNAVEPLISTTFPVAGGLSI